MAGTTAIAKIASNKSQIDRIWVIAINAFLYCASKSVAQVRMLVEKVILSVRSPSAPLKINPVKANKITIPTCFSDAIGLNPKLDAKLPFVK